MLVWHQLSGCKHAAVQVIDNRTAWSRSVPHFLHPADYRCMGGRATPYGRTSAEHQWSQHRQVLVRYRWHPALNCWLCGDNQRRQPSRRREEAPHTAGSWTEVESPFAAADQSARVGEKCSQDLWLVCPCCHCPVSLGRPSSWCDFWWRYGTNREGRRCICSSSFL